MHVPGHGRTSGDKRYNRSATPCRFRSPQRIAHGEDNPPPFTAVANVDEAQRRPVAMHTKSCATRRVEVTEVEISSVRTDLAGVGERRDVDVRKECPPRFNVEDLEIVIVKPVIVVSAQRVASAEARPQVERHDVSRWNDGEHFRRAKRENPV